MATATGCLLGIEIGGTKIQMFVTDSDYAVLERIKFCVGELKEAVPIQREIEIRLLKLLKKYDIESIGVGFGGPVNHKTGEIYRSFQVKGWEAYNLKTWLFEIARKPVFIDNDANIAALGEACLGAGSNFSSVFYITLGSGVGGGFVVDGEIFHGRRPGEFEVGHLWLSKSGETLESNCSGWSLNRKLKIHIEENTDSPLARLAEENEWDASKNLMKAIEQGDIKAKTILDDTIDDLALGLSHVVHIINPDVLVMGGGLSNFGDYLLTALLSSLPKYVMETMTGSLPVIALAELKEDAVPLGAAVYAKNNNGKTSE